MSPTEYSVADGKPPGTRLREETISGMSSSGMCPKCRISSFHTASFRPHGSMPYASGASNLAALKSKSGRGVSIASIMAVRIASWWAVSSGLYATLLVAPGSWYPPVSLL